VNDVRQWSHWLPRAAAIGGPLLFAAISISAEHLSLRDGINLSTRNRVIQSNLFFAVVMSAAGGLFCRERMRNRIGDLLGAGVYAFVAYMLITMLTVRMIE